MQKAGLTMRPVVKAQNKFFNLRPGQKGHKFYSFHCSRQFFCKRAKSSAALLCVRSLWRIERSPHGPFKLHSFLRPNESALQKKNWKGTKWTTSSFAGAPTPEVVTQLRATGRSRERNLTSAAFLRWISHRLDFTRAWRQRVTKSAWLYLSPLEAIQIVISILCVWQHYCCCYTENTACSIRSRLSKNDILYPPFGLLPSFFFLRLN